MVEQYKAQIRVQGWIGRRWANWFEGMAMVHEGEQDEFPTTLLAGTVADQAALRGLLARIWDLNLALISVIVGEGSAELEGSKASE